MAYGKPTPSPGSQWLDKISDMFGDADKNLDQVKKSIKGDLDTLKKSKDLNSLAANIYLSAEKGFRTDLNELGVTGEAQAPYIAMFKENWEKAEMDTKSNEILSSPELAKMDDFITQTQNLPKLRELIDSAEPQAKWKTMLSSIPGIGKYLDQLAPLLSSIGLGFLVKPKGKKEAGKKTDEKKEDKKDGKEKPAEGKDQKEVLGKPKSTMFMGDSLTVAIPHSQFKVEGKLKTVAKGGQSSRWGLEQAREMARQKPSPLKDYENVVVLFGTNDLLSKPENIIDNLKNLYKTLRDAGVKNVYAVTIPPIKGYTLYDKSPRANETRKKVNEWIRKTHSEGLTHRVIDLCKTESKGGIADDKDPEKLGPKAQSGDHLHFSKQELAEIYQRELERGSGNNLVA